MEQWTSEWYILVQDWLWLSSVSHEAKSWCSGHLDGIYWHTTGHASAVYAIKTTGGAVDIFLSFIYFLLGVCPIIEIIQVVLKLQRIVSGLLKCAFSYVASSGNFNGST
jgi:hypothetical protein